MELVLKRIAKKKGYTIGKLYICTERTEKTEGTELTLASLTFDSRALLARSALCDA